MTRATDVDGLLLGDFKTGDRIGDYRIDGRLPSLGSGIVNTATHVVLPRRAAIKVIPSSHVWTKTFATELLREACIVDALDHPAVPRVYECGVLEDTRPWVATELVAGDTLAQIIARAPLSPAAVAAMVRDVADLLAHIHVRGLVHNAIRPDTIVIPSADRRHPISIGEWSAARTLDSTNPPPLLSRRADLPFVAPETAADRPADGAGDIYALGTVAACALHGGLPPPGLAPRGPDVLLTSLVDRMPDNRSPGAAAVPRWMC